MQGFIRCVSIECISTLPDGLVNSQLVREGSITDLGVVLDERLSFSNHIHCKMNKCYSMLGIIKRKFRNISILGFVLIYKSIVRSHLDYCNSVWAPHKRADIEELEKVQKRPLYSSHH